MNNCRHVLADVGFTFLEAGSGNLSGLSWSSGRTATEILTKAPSGARRARPGRWLNAAGRLGGKGEHFGQVKLRGASGAWLERKRRKSPETGLG